MHVVLSIYQSQYAAELSTGWSTYRHVHPSCTVFVLVMSTQLDDFLQRLSHCKQIIVAT